jgi:hypothetical protein
MKGDQLTLFGDGYHRISDALEFDRRDIVTLDGERSTLKADGTADLYLVRSHVERYTRDILRDARNDLLVITTEEGGTLAVTPEHPLIDGDGKMVRARELRPGDRILHVSGARHTVAAVRESTVDERVYNADVQAAGQTSQVFVVQGYLSGTNRQQRGDLEDINRTLFREQLAQLADLEDDPRD